MHLKINRQWKTAIGAAIFLAAVPAWVAAQVAITLALPSAKVLLYEDIVATVTVQNNSGQILALDSVRGPVRFWLDVERNDGRIIPRCSDLPLLSDVEIMPGEARKFGFNVSRLYAMRSEGLYKIRAGVVMNGVNYVSSETILEIARGFEFQRLTVGVSGDACATRTYILSYFQKDGVENVYLRIEDADKTVYGMFNLGRVLRVRPTELKADEAGNVHVLFQTMGMGFVHAAFTPFGVQLFAKNYTGVSGRASLTQQANGQITVPDGIETMPPMATTVKASGASEKANKKAGTGGMLGQLMQSSSDKTP